MSVLRVSSDWADESDQIYSDGSDNIITTDAMSDIEKLADEIIALLKSGEQLADEQRNTLQSLLARPRRRGRPKGTSDMRRPMSLLRPKMVAVKRVRELEAAGTTTSEAVSMVAEEIGKSERTIYGWKSGAIGKLVDAEEGLKQAIHRSRDRQKALMSAMLRRDWRNPFKEAVRRQKQVLRNMKSGSEN